MRRELREGMVLWRGNDSHEEDKGFVYLVISLFFYYKYFIYGTFKII